MPTIVNPPGFENAAAGASQSTAPQERRDIRIWSRSYPGLRRVIGAVRFILRLGPWRNLCIRALRSLSANEALPRCAATLFPELAPEAMATRIEQSGFSPGLTLPKASVENILDYLEDRAESDRGHRDCEEIYRVSHDPELLEVVRRYLGAEPILHSSYLFWIHPRAFESTPYPERFHYDVSDFKGLCVYFYLSDVRECNGAHVAIEGTHRHKSLRQLVSPFLSDEAAEKYGSRVRTLTGPEGYGFFEDQLTYHKRLACREPRLALQLNYTLHRKPRL